MINYADRAFYVDKYKGSLSEDLFASLIVKASREIDKNVNRELTKEVIDNLNERDKWQLSYVACELCDFFKANENKNISSITIDGVSKVFKSNSVIRSEKIGILNGLPSDLTRYL